MNIEAERDSAERTERGTRMLEKQLHPKGSGLHIWRQRQAEDKRERMAELERLRADAVTVLRDGQEFRVVTIPGFSGRARPLPERLALSQAEIEERVGRRGRNSRGATS